MKKIVYVFLFVLGLTIPTYFALANGGDLMDCFERTGNLEKCISVYAPN